MVERSITVVQMLPELQGGGVERGTLEVGKYLSENGHKSIVISAGGRLVQQLEKEGSTHIKWRVGEKSPICLRYIISLRKFLLQEKVDILHLRSRLPAWVGYLAFKSLPERKRPKLVTTFHGFYSVNRYSAIMTKGEKIISVSNTITEHIIEKYGISGEKIVLIYRGVDDKYFDPEKVSIERMQQIKKSWELKKNIYPIILQPARITKLKGHELFFKSLSLIKDLPWIAICVGEIDKNSSVTSNLINLIKELDLQERVKLVGHCNDMPAALKISDIVVSSSIEPESFGRIAVEAQAMAKPVIATSHGGSNETVKPGETGWLVSPGNVYDMASALKVALSNKSLREKLGENGKEWVRNNFTTNKMCCETISLYKKLLGK